MAVNEQAYKSISARLAQSGVRLVAVSKTKPVADIEALYRLGQLDFGENYVQELVDKQAQLPAGIRWHFIGHLQSNKVKYIAPFVHLIHGVDSARLLTEIEKQGAKFNRVINCLLQVHIAQEATKFGMNAAELEQAVQLAQGSGWKHVKICGLMGMASFTDDMETVAREFNTLHELYNRFAAQPGGPVQFNTLSMGMSGDYETAITCGSNMVRIGSLLFGSR
jgi:PLP dependent protein